MKRILSTVLTLSVMLVSCIMTTGCEKNGGNGNGNEGEYGFTKSDAILAFDSFISNFFESRGQFARDTNMDGTTAVAWTQATMFDMIINAYKLTDDQKYMDLLNKHFEGCKNTFTFDWYDYSHWDLYDDMMWWVGALARAYQLTGNEEFLSVSEEGFKRVWYGKESNFDGKGWNELDAYGSFGGDDDTQIPGKPLTAIPAMYWDWKFARTGKMSCVHFPTMIAAIELYHCTGNEDYLEKAKTLYEYGSTKLFNKETGAIADSMHDENASADWRSLVYNQATAMAAFAMLYLETSEQEYLDNAVKAMDYIVREKSTAHDILKPERSTDQTNLTDEKGIYNAILATYIPVIIEDCGQTQYTEFIANSIKEGWGNRDSRNLTNKLLENRLNSSQAVSAYTASGVPALMLSFPGLKNTK